MRKLRGGRGHPPEQVPDKPAHLAGEGDGHLLTHQASSQEVPRPLVQPYLHLPREFPVDAMRPTSGTKVSNLSAV